MEMVWNLHDQVRRSPELVLARTTQDIRAAKAEGKVALVLTFEGCEALGSDLRFLDLYHSLGLRSASLTHTRRNIFGGRLLGGRQQGWAYAAGSDFGGPHGRSRDRYRPRAHC